MKYMKDIVVLVLAVGLMGILGLIVYDEFKMANEHGGELDENIIGLLQMSMTGVIGVVGGYIGKSMADMKIPVALVFAMAVQLVALVWYISGMVHDIEHLEGTVSAQQDIIDLLNDDVNDLWEFCTFTENKWAEAT